ncbi:MAG: PKD domain-containing protein [Planctomycetota bacterium]
MKTHASMRRFDDRSSGVRWRFLMIGMYAMCLAGILAAFLGCELESANSVTRESGIYVAGVYQHPTVGSLLVSENSGEPITRFDLRQSGDQLEAVDNNDSVWRGTLGKESDTLATYVLSGKTTAGKDATADGTIEVSGSSAIMRGSWTEASVYGVIYGVATVPLAPTNAPPQTNATQVAISPTSATLTNNSATVSFTASGGSGSYTWSVSAGSNGNVSPTTGSSVTYTRSTSGNNTVTVADASDSGNTASAVVTQP